MLDSKTTNYFDRQLTIIQTDILMHFHDELRESTLELAQRTSLTVDNVSRTYVDLYFKHLNRFSSETTTLLDALVKNFDVKPDDQFKSYVRKSGETRINHMIGSLPEDLHQYLAKRDLGPKSKTDSISRHIDLHRALAITGFTNSIIHKMNELEIHYRTNRKRFWRNTFFVQGILVGALVTIIGILISYLIGLIG